MAVSCTFFHFLVVGGGDRFEGEDVERRLV
jgi:hypothetical protein